MITSKRDLKKHIRRIEEEVSMVVIPAAFYTGLFTEEEASKALGDLAALTVQATTRLNITFDKAPKAFDSNDAYKKAKKNFYATAYAKALADYENGVNALLAPINAKAKN